MPLFNQGVFKNQIVARPVDVEALRRAAASASVRERLATPDPRRPEQSLTIDPNFPWLSKAGRWDIIETIYRAIDDYLRKRRGGSVLKGIEYGTSWQYWRDMLRNLAAIQKDPALRAEISAIAERFNKYQTSNKSNSSSRGPYIWPGPFPPGWCGWQFDVRGFGVHVLNPKCASPYSGQTAIWEY